MFSGLSHSQTLHRADATKPKAVSLYSMATVALRASQLLTDRLANHILDRLGQDRLL